MHKLTWTGVDVFIVVACCCWQSWHWSHSLDRGTCWWTWNAGRSRMLRMGGFQRRFREAWNRVPCGVWCWCSWTAGSGGGCCGLACCWWWGDHCRGRHCCFGRRDWSRWWHRWSRIRCGNCLGWWCWWICSKWKWWCNCHHSCWRLCWKQWWWSYGYCNKIYTCLSMLPSYSVVPGGESKYVSYLVLTQTGNLSMRIRCATHVCFKMEKRSLLWL